MVWSPRCYSFIVNCFSLPAVSLLGCLGASSDGWMDKYDDLKALFYAFRKVYGTGGGRFKESIDSEILRSRNRKKTYYDYIMYYLLT